MTIFTKIWFYTKQWYYSKIGVTPGITINKKAINTISKVREMEHIKLKSKLGSFVSDQNQIRNSSWLGRCHIRFLDSLREYITLRSKNCLSWNKHLKLKAFMLENLQEAKEILDTIDWTSLDIHSSFFIISQDHCTLVSFFVQFVGP